VGPASDGETALGQVDVRLASKASRGGVDGGAVAALLRAAWERERRSKFA
jgi:hypothetical protein